MLQVRLYSTTLSSLPEDIIAVEDLPHKGSVLIYEVHFGITLQVAGQAVEHFLPRIDDRAGVDVEALDPAGKSWSFRMKCASQPKIRLKTYILIRLNDQLWHRPAGACAVFAQVEQPMCMKGPCIMRWPHPCAGFG